MRRNWKNLVVFTIIETLIVLKMNGNVGFLGIDVNLSSTLKDFLGRFFTVMFLFKKFDLLLMKTNQIN